VYKIYPANEMGVKQGKAIMKAKERSGFCARLIF